MSFINNSEIPLGGSNKDDLMRQIKDELTTRSTTDLVNKMHERCFKRCVPSPGASLSKSENECLAMCVQKYMSTLDTVSKQWNSSISEMKTQQSFV